jgi:hypothetical protein
MFSALFDVFAVAYGNPKKGGRYEAAQPEEDR